MSGSTKLKQKTIEFPQRKLRPRTKSVKYDSDDDEDDFFRSTPSKRRCQSIENIKTVTPVRSKAKMKNSTPSSCFAKLNLESPEEKKKNILKPKSLFGSNARKAFHGANASSLPGREKELEKLTNFLLDRLEKESCGSLYISGLPGTGKTASLNYVIQQEKITSGYKIAKINCTSVSSSNYIYRKICEELGIKTISKTEKESIAAIENYLVNEHKMILLILDEIDQLETKSQSVLYKIFEWPSWVGARLVLVGIANAMDLTDRILPRLCAKVELKPVLMHFAPYSKDQITKILNHRLTEAGGDGVFASGAIELISAKVAGMSGDIRRALDLGRRVIEMSEEKKKAQTVAEASPKKKILTENNSPQKLAERNLSPRRSPRKMQATPQKKENATPRKLSGFDLSPRKSPRKIDFNVETKDVFNVVKNIYGSSKNFKSEDSCFPLHQKLLICTFLLVSKKGKAKDLVVSKLHQVYTKICKKRGLSPVDLSGFLFLCRQVEMTGVIQMGKGPGKLAKVILQWDETEISNAIQDTNLLSSILNDVTCLS